MDMSYEEIFRQRAAEYARACEAAPLAREQERRILVELLEAHSGDRVLDHPAGSGYLAAGLQEAAGDLEIICAEPVAAFAERIPVHFQRFRSACMNLALQSRCLDRVGSLAGLHHLESKDAFFGEAFRVLRPGGLLAAADVMTGTAAARFLNEAVDRWCTTGHQGIFFEPGEMSSRMQAAGFVDTQEQLHRFRWSFTDKKALLEFVRDLFGMARATYGRLEAEVAEHFSLEIDAMGVHLPWELVYARGRRP